MNPNHCVTRSPIDPMNLPQGCKPLYAHRFQPKSGMSLVEPSFEVPVFYCWSPQHVGTWLRSIGFRKYGDVFRNKGINGVRLYHMEAEDLYRAGVDSMADAEHIIALLKRIEYQAEQCKDATTANELPFNYYKSFYFGEEPLYLRDSQGLNLNACSK